MREKARGGLKFGGALQIFLFAARTTFAAANCKDSNSYLIGSMLAHYELYKKILHLPGAVVELGAFKGEGDAMGDIPRAS